MIARETPQEVSTAQETPQEVSRRILALVRGNSRITTVEMARKLGLTRGGVNYHLKAMKARKMIRVRVRLLLRQQNRLIRQGGMSLFLRLDTQP